MNICKDKIKSIEYYDKKLYKMNNIDFDKLTNISKFPICSITKIFTIIALLILQEQHKLNINDYIDKYLYNEQLKGIKIIDIINHKAGFIKNLNYDITKKFKSISEIYDYYKSTKLITHKYGTYNYSNVGYVILGVIIEKVSNKKYFNFIKKYILIPLKMNNTISNKPNITLYDSKCNKCNKFNAYERFISSSAGQLISTISDLIKFSKFSKLLNDNSLAIIKTLYIYKKKNNGFTIYHKGEMIGSQTLLEFKYNNNWQIINTHLKFNTIFEKN
jgi:CubicO group peptidase (beta-lactamase class C family)